MKKTIRRKIFQGLLATMLLSQNVLMAQPTPGDTNHGALDGGVVGGGADLSINIWFVLVLALFYFLYKRKERIFQWYLDLPWGDYSS